MENIFDSSMANQVLQIMVARAVENKNIHLLFNLSKSYDWIKDYGVKVATIILGDFNKELESMKTENEKLKSSLSELLNSLRKNINYNETQKGCR